MDSNIYRCSAVFSAQNILVYKDGVNCHAKISGRINEQVLVGDYISCEMIYDELFVKKIVNRKNIVKRLQNGKMQGLAANVDIVFIVTSANQDFNIARLERYYIVAKESVKRICFVLSKTDLTDKSDELASLITKRFPNCSVEKTSIYNNKINLFNYWTQNETAIFIGSSGVGKSSLINYMLSSEVIKTKEIRQDDGHGKHTTTTRHMYVLANNRKIIDTPGLRGVGISSKSNSIEELFPEIKELEIKCKYRNCTHISEPGCAIREAIDNNEMDYERYLRYLKLSGDEAKRNILLKGKAYKKKQILKELKKSNNKSRMN